MNWLQFADLPEADSPFTRDWFALRFDAADFRANLSRVDIDRLVSKFPGDWRYARMTDAYPVLRSSAAKQDDGEQLRRLQEQVAAQRATLDIVLERARQIVDVARRNEG